MKKNLKFIFTTTWILLSRSYDAYCTYALTPDLSKEANPLVSIVGISSWTTMLVILSLLTIYAIYAYYVSLFRPMNLTPKEEGYSFGDFVAFLYLGQKDSWTSVLYKFPKSFTRATNYFGHLLTTGLVFAGIVSTIMWLLINNTEFYKSIHSAALIYVVLVLGILIIAFNWNKKLYQQYLVRTQLPNN